MWVADAMYLGQDSKLCKGRYDVSEERRWRCALVHHMTAVGVGVHGS